MRHYYRYRYRPLPLPLPLPTPKYGYMKYVIFMLVVMLIVVMLSNGPQKLLWSARPVIYGFMADVQPGILGYGRGRSREPFVAKQSTSQAQQHVHTQDTHDNEERQQQQPPVPQHPHARWGNGGKMYVKTSQSRRHLTKKQKRLVLERYGRCCGMCRKVLEHFDTEFDHITPLAADRTSQYRMQLNAVSSFQPLCRRCHGYKCHLERRAGLYTR